MQLLDNNISMIDPLKKKEITKDQVNEKFGVGPNKVIEVQALAGDTSDNIPGVPGIGPKIASQLINDFGDVENLIKNVHQIKQEKRRNSIIENKDLLLISKKLVTLKDDVDLPIKISDLKFNPLKVEKLLKFLEDMEFNRIKTLVINKFGSENHVDKKLNKNDKYELNSHGIDKNLDYFIPKRNKVNKDLYQLIKNSEDLTNWIKKAKKSGKISIDCETTSINAVDAEIVGFSMSLENSEACYVPLSHQNYEHQVKLDVFKTQIKEVLEDISILKIGQNIKYDYIILRKLGIKMVNMDDTMLMSYVLRTGERGMVSTSYL